MRLLNLSTNSVEHEKKSCISTWPGLAFVKGANIGIDILKKKKPINMKKKTGRISQWTKKLKDELISG